MADESIPDWRLLAPHRPLGPADGGYVDRPTGGGDAIANWVIAGGSTVLVSGPTGVGKSTELARAAQALQATRVACLVQIDRMTNVHRLSAGELMHLVAQRLVVLARDDLRLPISEELESATAGYVEDGDLPELRDSFRSSGATAANIAVAEVARRSKPGRVALLIDGLEKLLAGPDAREIFEALSQLPDKVDLIVVIPWHVAFGGSTDALLRAGERLHRIAPLDTEGTNADDTKGFFRQILVQRLMDQPGGFEAWMGVPLQLVYRAVTSSGGIPRVFLQLMADAGTYARAKRGAAWPDDSDLSDAIADQQDSYRRALLPGDTQAIVAVTNTDGRELDLERRVRLLAQGILLERVRDGRVILEPHPLVAYAVANPRS